MIFTFMFAKKLDTFLNSERFIFFKLLNLFILDLELNDE